MTLIKKSDAQDLIAGRHIDPFSVLGLHMLDGKQTLRAFHPGADSIEALDAKTGRRICALSPVGDGLFAGQATRRKSRFAYRLRITKGADTWVAEDAYRFGPVLGELDEHLIGEGAHRRLWDVLGSHVMTHEGVEGTHFAVWAPNARRVSVVGDFNGWDGRRHVMRSRGTSGVWEIFAPGVSDGEPYKYELQDLGGHLLPQKADPFAFGAEHPPKTASVVRQLKGHDWTDAGWMSKREALHRIDQPISIYEVHLGSWRRVPEEGNRPLSYHEHAAQLVGYAKDMGFTHIFSSSKNLVTPVAVLSLPEPGEPSQPLKLVATARQPLSIIRQNKLKRI